MTTTEKSQLIEDTITEIRSKNMEKNDEFITKICNLNNVSEKHIRKVANFGVKTNQ